MFIIMPDLLLHRLISMDAGEEWDESDFEEVCVPSQRCHGVTGHGELAITSVAVRASRRCLHVHNAVTAL